LPGYFESGASVLVEFAMECSEEEPVPTSGVSNYKIRESPNDGLFSRLVVVDAYHENERVKGSLAFVRDHNAKSLLLTSGQTKAMSLVRPSGKQLEDKNLDLLTGFVLIDRSSRIMVVEGFRGGVIGDLSEVLRDSDTHARSPGKLLIHPKIGFPNRIYGAFNLCLKQVKLRSHTLEALSVKPDICLSSGNRVVSDAIQCLLNIKRVPRLKMLRTVGSFPSAQAISEIETQLGEFVTDIELEGGCAQGYNNKHQ